MLLEGRSTTKNELEASQALRRACDLGLRSGYTNLGVLYERGVGIARDEGRAAALYEQGSQRGDAAGCHNLAALCELARVSKRVGAR